MKARLAAASLVSLVGCKGSMPCMTVSAMNDLLTTAALVRVDVYDGAIAQCAGPTVMAQSAPLLSHSFPGGAVVRLDIPPGQRTIVMTTYGDAAGMMPTGRACTEAKLSGDRSACLSLSLVPVGSSLSCASDADCVGADGGAVARPRCNLDLHQCVACLSPSDCPNGQECGTGGQCAEACDASGNCGGGLACCSPICVDLANDPLNCGGCGKTCDTNNSIGASCSSGVCMYSSCPAGRADCDKTAPNLNGCECPTDLCCATACQPVHMVGIDQKTYVHDCDPLGTPGDPSTYTLAMAQAAAAAWMPATDQMVTCGSGQNMQMCLRRDTGSTCATWCFAKGIVAGWVREASTCTCPTNATPSAPWN